MVQKLRQSPLQREYNTNRVASMRLVIRFAAQTRKIRVLLVANFTEPNTKGTSIFEEASALLLRYIHTVIMFVQCARKIYLQTLIKFCEFYNNKCSVIGVRSMVQIWTAPRWRVTFWPTVIKRSLRVKSLESFHRDTNLSITLYSVFSNKFRLGLDANKPWNE